MKIASFKMLDKSTVQQIEQDVSCPSHLWILLSSSPAKKEQDDSGQDGERKEDASHHQVS